MTLVTYRIFPIIEPARFYSLYEIRDKELMGSRFTNYATIKSYILKHEGLFDPRIENRGTMKRMTIKGKNILAWRKVHKDLYIA